MPQDNNVMKEVKARLVTVGLLEEQIFEREGVRLVIRAPRDMHVACGYNTYFERGLGDDSKVELLVKRIHKLLGERGPEVTIVGGNGKVISNLKTPLGKIREGYNV